MMLSDALPSVLACYHFLWENPVCLLLRLVGLGFSHHPNIILLLLASLYELAPVLVGATTDGHFGKPPGATSRGKDAGQSPLNLTKTMLHTTLTV